MLSHLLRCPLDIQPGSRAGVRKTWYFKEKDSPRGKGIFGHVTSVFGGVETQARGALHFHILVWGGITPKLMEEGAGIPEVCQKIQEALDSVICAQIPRHDQLAGLLKEHLK